MNYIASKFVDYLIANGIASISMRQIHIYGFEVILGKALNYGILLLLSYINGNMLQTLLFMLIFFSLRGRTGGYHAKKASSCCFGTIIIYFAVSGLVVPFLSNNIYAIWGIVIFSTIVIFSIAPINHPNLGLDEQEVKGCKKVSRWLTMLAVLGVVLSIRFNINQVYVASIVAGIGLDAGLLLFAKILKQEVEK